MTGTPIKQEAMGSSEETQTGLTPRELALAEHIANSLTSMFEQRLALVRNESMAYMREQTEVIADLVRGVHAQAVPEAVAAAGRTAAHLLQEQA